jgi:uncharacterized membrane protein
MSTTRLEAFSDGVIAILITIMVLEFKTPEGHDWPALAPLTPKFCAYVLSFVFIGIYWNNHHHMLHLTHRVTGAILWANLHLLFWLSLVPFSTAWMGETLLAPLPTAVYGTVLFLSGVAFTILENRIIASQGEGSPLKAAIGADKKGKASVLLYAAAIPLAFVRPWMSAAIYVVVALLWLVPDRRIEAHLKAGERS